MTTKMFTPSNHPEGFLAILAGIGAAIGLGKLLNSNAPMTPRLVFGRAITSAGIGAAAGATTLLFPTADPLVLYGVASFLASVGTSALEAILKAKAGSD